MKIAEVRKMACDILSLCVFIIALDDVGYGRRVAPVYKEARSTLKTSSREPANLASAVFQLMTFQMLSTYAAFPLRYCSNVSVWGVTDWEIPYL